MIIHRLFLIRATVIATVLLLAGVWFISRPEPVASPDLPGCTQEAYDALPPIQVPEACSTLWVYVCSEHTQTWIQQCLNGEVDLPLLTERLIELRDELQEASSTFQLPQG